MHVPWCISGSLTRGCGENVPGIPAHAQPTILRSWQEAHDDNDDDAGTAGDDHAMAAVTMIVW